MDIKLLEKYIKLCRKLGVTDLKIGEIEVKLSAELPKSPYQERKDKAVVQQMLPQLSENDTLFWSSAGINITDEGSNG